MQYELERRQIRTRRLVIDSILDPQRIAQAMPAAVIVGDTLMSGPLTVGTIVEVHETPDDSGWLVNEPQLV